MGGKEPEREEEEREAKKLQERELYSRDIQTELPALRFLFVLPTVALVALECGDLLQKRFGVAACASPELCTLTLLNEPWGPH